MPRYNQKSVTVSISLKNKIKDYMKSYNFHSQPQAIEDALAWAEKARKLAMEGKEAAVN